MKHPANWLKSENEIFMLPVTSLQPSSIPPAHIELQTLRRLLRHTSNSDFHIDHNAPCLTPQIFYNNNYCF